MYGVFFKLLNQGGKDWEVSIEWENIHKKGKIAPSLNLCAKLMNGPKLSIQKNWHEISVNSLKW